MQLEALYWKICNPTASLYNSRTQLHAAIEFACIDIIGKKLGIRACDLLGRFAGTHFQMKYMRCEFCRIPGTHGVTLSSRLGRLA